MTVVFSRVISREQNLQPCNLQEEHGCSQNMAGGVWGNSHTSDGMRGVKVDGLDHGVCVEMVLFRVHLDPGLGVAGHIADTDGVLDEPFVDGFCGMGHKDTALEVGLCEDVWQRGRVIDVKTGHWLVSCWRNASERVERARR